MRSTTSTLGPTQIVRPERIRQQAGKRHRTRLMVDQHPGAAVLPQQLPASTARHQYDAGTINAGQCDESSAARRRQRRNDSAFGAEGESVRRVLDVAACLLYTSA